MAIYFLIDVNNAFLSMHAAYLLQQGSELDIRSIPSVIGGSEASRHGIVLAKSDPAKRVGIKTGMTLRDARTLCEHLNYVTPRYDIYVKSSRAMNEIFRQYSMFVEPYSIDESWISFEGHNLIYDDYEKLAYEIKDRINRELGFTVNIGISTSKLLSKMASNLKKPNMVHTLYKHEVETKMWCLDIRDLHGIGASIEKKLRSYGINTIGEIVNRGEDFMKEIFKSYGVMIYHYCLGEDYSLINNPKHIRVESIGNSSTSRFNIETYQDAYNLIMTLSETIGMRLRNRNMRALLVSVAIKSTEFKVVRKQEKIKLSIAATSDLIKHAKRLFNILWDGETPIRHIEVRVSHLLPEYIHRQLILFEEDQPNDRDEQIDNVIDELRDRFGSQSIVRARLLHSGLRSMSGGHPGGDEVPNMRSEL